MMGRQALLQYVLRKCRLFAHEEFEFVRVEQVPESSCFPYRYFGRLHQLEEADKHQARRFGFGGV